MGLLDFLANIGKSINDTVVDHSTTFDKHLNGQKPSTFFLNLLCQNTWLSHPKNIKIVIINVALYMNINMVFDKDIQLFTHLYTH